MLRVSEERCNSVLIRAETLASNEPAANDFILEETEVYLLPTAFRCQEVAVLSPNLQLGSCASILISARCACRHPKDIGLQADGPSPWLKLFQNAREWCTAART